MFTNANTHYEAFIYYVNSVRMQNGSKTHRIRSFGLLTSASLQQRYCTQQRTETILFLTICQHWCRLVLRVLSALHVVGHLIGFSGRIDVLLAQETRLVG